MVQCWNIALSAYSYEIQYHKAESLSQTDHQSPYAVSKAVLSGDCLLVQPLPVNRLELIRKIRQYYHAILSCVCSGRKADVR